MTTGTARYQAKARDITRRFDNNFRASTPVYPKLCMIRGSDGYDEKYGWLGNFPQVREWIGDRQFEELRAFDYTLKNKDWEQSMPIDKNDIADGRMGMYNDAASQLGIEGGYHPDELLFDIIKAGTTGLCFDGQPFFDASHNFGANSDTPNQSNIHTATGTTTPSRPTLAEFEAAYNEALLLLQTFKSDNGKYFNRSIINNLDALTLAYPPGMNSVVDQYFRSTLVGGGNTNVIVQSVDAPNRLNTPHLIDEPDAFYLAVTGGAFRPFIFQDRMRMRRMVKGSDDIEEKHVKFMTWSRYNIGYLFWWLCVRVKFT